MIFIGRDNEDYVNRERRQFFMTSNVWMYFPYLRALAKGDLRSLGVPSSGSAQKSPTIMDGRAASSTNPPLVISYMSKLVGLSWAANIEKPMKSPEPLKSRTEGLTLSTWDYPQMSLYGRRKTKGWESVFILIERLIWGLSHERGCIIMDGLFYSLKVIKKQRRLNYIASKSSWVGNESVGLCQWVIVFCLLPSTSDIGQWRIWTFRWIVLIEESWIPHL